MRTPGLLSKELRARLIENGTKGREFDHLPVVKLYDPGGPSTWLLTEMRPDDTDLLYGLIHDTCREHGPALGYVSLRDLEGWHGQLREPVSHDPRFAPRYPLSVYKVAARLIGCVTEDIETLYLVATNLGIRPVAP